MMVSIIPDKRHQSYIKHNLVDTIVIAFFAILAESNEWADMEIFTKKQEKWLRKFLELPIKFTKHYKHLQKKGYKFLSSD